MPVKALVHRIAIQWLGVLPFPLVHVTLDTLAQLVSVEIHAAHVLPTIIVQGTPWKQHVQLIPTQPVDLMPLPTVTAIVGTMV